MLTFKTDKLPALSGLAHEYQKTLRDRYLAGLWEIDLPAALCWSTVRNRQRLPKAYAEYIASWIWASVDGHVRFISDRPWDYETLPGCEVKSVQVAPLGKDPMGRVRSGRLVISAPMRRARCRRRGGRTRRSLLLQGRRRRLRRRDETLGVGMLGFRHFGVWDLLLSGDYRELWPDATARSTTIRFPPRGTVLYMGQCERRRRLDAAESVDEQWRDNDSLDRIGQNTCSNIPQARSRFKTESEQSLQLPWLELPHHR